MPLFDDADALATAARWDALRQVASEYANDVNLSTRRAGPRVDREFLLSPPLNWPPGWVERILGPERFGSLLLPDGRWCLLWRIIDPTTGDPTAWTPHARQWPEALTLVRDAAAVGRYDRQDCSELIVRTSADERAASRHLARDLRRQLPDDLHRESIHRGILAGETRVVRGLTADDWCALVTDADGQPLGAAEMMLYAEAIAREECAAAVDWLTTIDLAESIHVSSLVGALHRAVVDHDPWSSRMLDRLALVANLTVDSDLAPAARRRLAQAGDLTRSRAIRDAVAGASPAAWQALLRAGVRARVLVPMIGVERLADWAPRVLADQRDERGEYALVFDLVAAAGVAVADAWAARLATGDTSVGPALLHWCRQPRPRRLGLSRLRRRLTYVLERPTPAGRIADEAVASLLSAGWSNDEVSP